MAKPSTALYLISGQPLNRPQQPLLDPEQGWMNKRLVSIVPKPAGKPSKPFVFTPPGQSPGLSPGQTPGKSDRKCRKVRYGINLYSHTLHTYNLFSRNTHFFINIFLKIILQKVFKLQIKLLRVLKNLRIILASIFNLKDCKRNFM